MASLKLCLLWTLLALCLANEQNNFIDIDRSLKTLSTHPTRLQSKEFSTISDIVLIADNVQKCTTALISHLTDSNLTALDSGVHVDTRNNFHDDTIDINNSDHTHGMHSDCSSTDAMVPQFINDPTNGIDYYNYGGFGAHETLEHAILAMGSIEKLMDRRRRIKLIFTINLPPNRLYEVSRTDFLLLAQDVTAFVRNITKYRDSIMLVVTEFQDFYTNTDGQYQFIDDRSMIARVASFLYRVKHSLTNQPKIGEDDAKIIDFIDILLEKQENEYMKIGVSRHQPSHHSAARNWELLYEEQQRIISIINYRLRFVESSSMDFNTAISAEVENTVRHRIVDVQNRVINDIETIDLAIKEFYALKETNMFDVLTFDSDIATAILKLSAQIRPDRLKPFKAQLISIMNELHISISTHCIEQFSTHIDYIDLLQNITGIQNRRFFIPITPLKSTIKYLTNIKKWYSFVIKLSTALDQYTVQQRITLSDVAALLGNCSKFSKNIGAEVNANEIRLSEFVDKVGVNIFHLVANMTLNVNQLNALKSAVGCAFKPIEVKCVANKLTIIGYNVKMSDVHAIDCVESATIIEIFAWNKLFVDADISKAGQRAHIAFVAPMWEIIGERRIDLSGKNAENIVNESAVAGAGSSGHFIGIGNTFMNDEQLEIVCVGGNGSNSDARRDATGMLFK